MIGGVVLDAAFVAQLVRGDLGALAWLDTYRTLGTPVSLPSLALSEVRAVRPDSGPLLAGLLGHPCVLLRELDLTMAARVDEFLQHAGVWDAHAAHVVLLTRDLGVRALTADPARLTRLDPEVNLDPL